MPRARSGAPPTWSASRRSASAARRCPRSRRSPASRSLTSDGETRHRARRSPAAGSTASPTRCASAGTTIDGPRAVLQHAGAPEIPPLRRERDPRRARGGRHARAGPPRRRLRARGGRHAAARACRRARRRRSGSPAVWGRELAGTLDPVDYAAGAFRVAGFVQRPGDAQPTGRRTQLFVNGRPFKDPFLVRAAEAGYRVGHPSGRSALGLSHASRPRPRTWT